MGDDVDSPRYEHTLQTTWSPQQRSAEATVNEDRALMRFELLEALLRVAITMRDNESQDEMSPAEKVRQGFGLRRRKT